MHKIFARLKQLNGFSVIVGMLIGAAVGLMLFSYMVPNGTKMIGLYHRAISKQKAVANKDAFSAQMNAMNHEGHTMNPYMMNPVTSEKQFLEDMKLHHEAAIMMAEQVLKLPSLHPEVRMLAEAVIKAQKQEVKDMSAWLSNFTW